MVANDSSYLLEGKMKRVLAKIARAGMGSAHCAPGITAQGEDLGADSNSTGLLPGDHMNSGLLRPRDGRKVCI